MLVGVLVSIIAGGYYLIFKSDFLVIKKIDCRVENKTSLADEKRWCEEVERRLLGRRIFYSNRPAVADELEKKFLPVGEVSFINHYPQTVGVVIKERQPVAKVSLPGGLPFLIDREGVLYSEVVNDVKDLKSVILDLGFDLSLGQKMESSVISLIELREPVVESIKYVSSEGIEVTADPGLVILFSRKKSISSQIEVLNLMVKRYRIEGQGLKKVDLRFDKPVVVY